MDHIDIRLAVALDAPSLAALRYDFRSSNRAAIEEKSKFVERCAVWMAQNLKEGSSWQCWVAEHEQNLIGTLWLKLIEKIPNPAAEPECHGYISNFYLSESWRGQGIGSRLLATVLDWCKSHRVHTVILWPTEQSRRLYERYGFAVHSDLLELVIADVYSK